MVTILDFYLSTLLFAIPGFLFIHKLFPKNAGKNYAFSRIFGLLIISYLSWIFAYVLRIKITTVSILALVFVTTLLGLYLNKSILKTLLKKYYKPVLLYELLFIIFFSAMLLYRSATPNIEDIEKFMDFGIYNGLYRAETVPPKDVWMSGKIINYYYFGQYSLVTINKINHIDTAVSYNLNVALIFASAGVMLFAICFVITNNFFASLFGALLLIVAGNIDIMFHDLSGTTTGYFYADARSLIKYTINEFPAYSFLISDLHAHIIDLLYVVLMLGLTVNYFFTATEETNIFQLGVLALSLGALGVTNTWDLIIYAPLVFLITLWKHRLKVPEIFAVAPISILLFLPYYIDFNSATSGVGIVTQRDEILPIMKMFGYFFMASLLYVTFFVKNKFVKPEHKLVGLFFMYALFLVCVPEVVFLKDIYFKLNPPYSRANTVFKVWYQAWVLFCIATACAYFYLIKRFWPKIKKIKTFPIFLPFIMDVALLTFFVFKYPINSVRYITGDTYENKGLNGEDYLKSYSLGDYILIKYLNQNITGQPIILEAAGSSYTHDSVISSYTGLPTVIGWSDHELGWRADWPYIANRLGDIEIMYKSSDIEKVSELVKQYGIQYVVISGTERAKYGANAGETLKELYSTIYESDGVTLLKTN